MACAAGAADPGAAPANTLMIKALGSLAGNVGPIMKIRVNGTEIGSTEVRNTSFQNFTYTFPALTAGTRIDIVFSNDAVIGSEDRNLLIDSVTLNGETLSSDLAVYDRGKGSAAFDGINVVPVQWMKWGGALRFIVSSGLTSNQMGLVINDNDPYSVAIGEYYRTKRAIPSLNIVHVKLPVTDTVTQAQFAPVKTQIDAALPPTVQAAALAWTRPYRVECNSITSAVSFGFQANACQGVYPKASPYFESFASRPFTALGIRPTMLLAARTQAEGKALIDKGLSSNHTSPSGTAYLMKTSDSARNQRAAQYLPGYLGKVISSYVNVIVLAADALQKQDILFYFQGLPNVSQIGGANRYLPGAIADNMTSFGGVLFNEIPQTSILEFIGAGATGSYGTVHEPTAATGRFPNPKILMSYYTKGHTLIEAYWASVEEPSMGLFIGDPLANPWEVAQPYKEKNPPGAPQGLQASYSTGGDNVFLSWAPTPAGDFDLAGYYIYRNGVKIGSSRNFGSYTAAQVSDYTDQSPNPATYRYTVAAVSVTGKVSLQSAAVTVLVPDKVPGGGTSPGR